MPVLTHILVRMCARTHQAESANPPRRDSFDDFIVRRAGAQAKSAAPGGRSTIAWQLKRVAEDLDTVASAIQAVNSGTAHFTIAEDGSLQPSASASILVDHLAGVAKKAHRQSLLVAERQNEITIIAQASYSDGATEAAGRWSGALAVAAEELATAVKPLVALTREIDAGSATAAAILAPIDAVTGAASRVLAAARNDAANSSQLFYNLQEATRLLVGATTVLVHADLRPDEGPGQRAQEREEDGCGEWSRGLGPGGEKRRVWGVEPRSGAAWTDHAPHPTDQKRQAWGVEPRAVAA